MQRYLVTGGAGFIGSNLVEELVRRGKDVRVLDNLATGRRANLEPFMGQIEFQEGDLRDLRALRRAMVGVEVVLHQAALPSVPASVSDPQTSAEVNVTGTLNVLLAARDAGARRVVFASSCAVYGNCDVLPIDEETPLAPRSPYAASKLAGEAYSQAFSAVFGLPTIALRYFNVFGPRQDPSSDYAAVIPCFIAKMARGEAPQIYGDGRQTRDFVYVGNVVEANLLAAEAPPELSGIFNVAGGQRISLLELVEALNAILGRRLRAHHQPERAGDVRDSHARIDRIGAALGFRPAISFAEGLRRTAGALLASEQPVEEAPLLSRERGG